MQDTKEQSVRVIKFDFEHLKERFYFDGCKYTPLYEMGIKKPQNKPMETTQNGSLSTLKF